MLNQPGDFASLCPFTIQGDEACPSQESSRNTHFVIQSDLSLVCDLTAGLGDECIIDCPYTQFIVVGGFTAQSITFRGGTTPVIVYAGGTFTSKASSFENNVEGAIIGNEGSTVSIIQGSSFTGNEATKGGGIFTEGNLVIDGSTFSNNAASLFGGAVYAGTASTLSLAGSTFRENTAGLGGPAVFTEAPQSQVSYENTLGCDNVLPASGVICNGVVFTVTSEGTQCFPFDQDCETQSPTQAPTPEQDCASYDVWCVIARLIRAILESMLPDAPTDSDGGS